MTTTALKREVWRTRRAGDLGRLELIEEVMPPLAADQVRIQVHAVGLNFADIFALTGLYSATPRGSFVPGLEVCGTVLALGQDVLPSDSLKIGDRVMAVTRFGGYASHVDVVPVYCIRLPDDWSYEEGAGFPVQTLTAWYALKVLGDIRPGQTVLVHSAAGGVGMQALALCKKRGVRVLGSVGSPVKRLFLEERGVGDVFVRGPSIKPDVRRLLNGGELILVLDAVGGRVFRESYDLLSPTGRIIVFGAAQFTPEGSRPNPLKLARRYLTRPKLDPMEMITANKSVMGFNLIWLWNRPELLVPLLRETLEMRLPCPYIGAVFPFSHAKKGGGTSAKRKVIGQSRVACFVKCYSTPRNVGVDSPS